MILLMALLGFCVMITHYFYSVLITLLHAASAMAAMNLFNKLAQA